MARRRYNPSQPRGKNGKWISRGVSKIRTKRAVRSARIGAAKGFEVKGFKNKARAGQLTGGSRSRAKASGGKGKYGIAVVPYARGSLRSSSGGVNAGMNVGRNKRISIGGYARIENREANRTEKALRNVNTKVVEGLVKKISPHEKTDSLVRANIQMARAKAVNKAIGGQRNVAGGKATVRLGISRGGMPSVIIQKGVQKVAKDARRAGVDEYDKAMRKVAGSKPAKKKRAKNRRPERRNAA